MEIRDMRNGEWHWVYDSVIADPHISPTDKVVYSALSTFGGYKEMHPALETIAERACLSERATRNSMRRLEEVGYIKVDKKTGRGNANVYYLLKMVKGCKLCPFYKGGKEEPERGQILSLKGANLAPHINKESNKENIAEVSAVWVLEEKLKDMEKKPNSHLDIIASFIREKPVVVENSKQLSTVISRYVRVAQKLSGAYSNEQIFEVVERIRGDNEVRKKKGQSEIDWTLETIMKYLTK